MRKVLCTAVLAATLGFSGCSRGDPPSYRAAGVSESAAPLPPPTPHDAGPTDAAPDVIDAGTIDPGTLAQTEDKPRAEGTVFDARVEALWEAIVNDDPDRATPFFFPKTAYAQVKALVNPESDWKYRLVAAYKRDIHAAHVKLGRQATEARFVAFDVPQDHARWVDPGEEGNKLGYFRVYGTRLRYEIDGQPRTLDVTSLISWRGEWYVVHLSSFK